MNFIKINIICTLVCVAALLSGCASIPAGISSAPSQNPMLVDVQKDVVAYQGKSVRWAGDIIAVENSNDGSLLFVVARDVDSKGEPILNDRSLGRFVVRMPEFIEPEIYQEGRKITVKGVLSDLLERKIGDFEYSYPVINSDTHYLWPKRARYNSGRSHRLHRSYRWYGNYYPWYWYPHYDY